MKKNEEFIKADLCCNTGFQCNRFFIRPVINVVYPEQRSKKKMAVKGI